MINKIIKLEHFGQYGFEMKRYLVDHYPGLCINNKYFYLLKFTLEELSDILKTLEYKELYCNSYFISKSEDSIIFINTDYVGFTKIEVLYTENFDIGGLSDKLKPYFKPEEEEKGPKFSFLTLSGGRIGITTRQSPKEIKIDYNNSYNLDCSLEDIKNSMNLDKSGLLLFHSSPGAGKSSLIKWLTQEFKDKQFYFVPSSLFHIFSEPSFTEFFLDNLKDAILVLEDCEVLLADRTKSKGYDISTILNLTDGIMGDMMNTKIIATINTTDSIDSALLRKGRLIKKVEFKPLERRQAENLANSLGFTNHSFTTNVMLSDVYNLSDNGASVQKRASIGFK
jgi:hypothetical protein